MENIWKDIRYNAAVFMHLIKCNLPTKKKLHENKYFVSRLTFQQTIKMFQAEIEFILLNICNYNWF